MFGENKDYALKKLLIKKKNVIKKKFKELHNQQSSLNQHINEKYRPIIEPLHELTEATKNIKKENIELIEPKKENPQRSRQTSRHSSTHNSRQRSRQSSRQSSGQSSRKSSIKTLNFFDARDTKKEEEEEDGARGGVEARAGIEKNSFHSTKNNQDNDIADYGSYLDPVEDSPADSAMALAPKERWTPATVTQQRLTKSIAKRDNKTYYSIHYDNDGQMFFGAEKVTLEGKEIHMGDYSYPLTPGLYSLISSKNPSRYSVSDTAFYKAMLQQSNAHRKGYRSTGGIVRDRSNSKYVNIVSKIFPNTRSGDGLSTKRSLQKDYMIYNKLGGNNFTYWDDPNELVERLKLLIASQSAGHTAHNNEIISIIEELREAAIIV